MLDVSPGEVALAKTVLIHGPLSRTALTTKLGLSPATLTRLAKPLLDSGVLVELADAGERARGRPAYPLDITPTAGHFLGVKLTGDRLYAVVTDVRADPVQWWELPLGVSDPAAVVQLITDVLAQSHPSRVIGIGVSLGGLVRAGEVEFASYLGWEHVDFAPRLSEATGVPVTVENDLVALAEAERWFGLGRGKPGFVVITIGAGIGYAVVIGDDVVHTADSGVGTAGHLPLAPAGPTCFRGHVGCAHSMLTIEGVEQAASAAVGHHLSYQEALTRAAAGDQLVAPAISDAGRALGRFIALAMNLTFQSSVVLAGEGIGLYENVADLVRETIDTERDPHAAGVSISVDDSGFQAWARGAAAIAIQSAMNRMQIT